MKDANWFEVEDVEEVNSPALMIYQDRVKYNAELMIQISEDVNRLRPHIKTHKISEIIHIQQALGIQKYKCATIKEAELLAKNGALDVLLAMQPVSIHLEFYSKLIQQYPKTNFSTLIDNAHTLKEFNKVASEKDLILDVWLDINNGMNRTGIEPGIEAELLYKSIWDDPRLNLKGLHVYDGHIHNHNAEDREVDCDRYFLPVLDLKTNLESQGYKVPKIIAGGTPTFPIHKKRRAVDLSPGTPLLWDEGYSSSFNDLKFLCAAVILTRIISKPGKDLICFDLGHKSVASEMKLPRVSFLGNHSFEQISQSEEHLVVKTTKSHSYNIGDIFYAIPMHVCPTVSKYPEALVIQDKKISGTWKIAARDH